MSMKMSFKETQNTINNHYDDIRIKVVNKKI